MIFSPRTYCWWNVVSEPTSWAQVLLPHIYIYKKFENSSHNKLPFRMSLVQLFETEFFEKNRVFKKCGMKLGFLKKLRLCLVIVFIFYFQKLVFENIKKKTIFLYFLNQKHVWLVEIKKIVFWRKKIKNTKIYCY